MWTDRESLKISIFFGFNEEEALFISLYIYTKGLGAEPIECDTNSPSPFPPTGHFALLEIGPPLKQKTKSLPPGPLIILMARYLVQLRHDLQELKICELFALPNKNVVTKDGKHIRDGFVISRSDVFNFV